MKATVVRAPTPSELTRIERHEAWLEYLESIRLASPARYEQVEVWAWQRLAAKLRRSKANLCAEHKEIEVKKAAQARGNGHQIAPPRARSSEELAEEGFELKARGLVTVGRRLDRAIKTYRPAKSELDQAIEGWRTICRELAGDDPRP